MIRKFCCFSKRERNKQMVAVNFYLNLNFKSKNMMHKMKIVVKIIHHLKKNLTIS